MKPCSIPAIDTIPQHWHSAQVRNVIHTITDGPFGSAFTSADYSSDGAAVVRLGNVRRSGYDHSNQAYIPLELFATFTQFAVHEGDVLIAGLGDDRNHAGRACVAPNLGPAMVKRKCFRVRIDEQRVDAKFLSTVLSSEPGAAQIAARSQGSSRTMINLAITKNLRIPLPPLHEQTRIVKGLRAQLEKIDLLVRALDQQLSLLAEYREALITAAVTGEIDVDTFDNDRNLEVATP
jgi:type I restriction enzyme S subunit